MLIDAATVGVLRSWENNRAFYTMNKTASTPPIFFDTRVDLNAMVDEINRVYIRNAQLSPSGLSLLLVH